MPYDSTFDEHGEGSEHYNGAPGKTLANLAWTKITIWGDSACSAAASVYSKTFFNSIVDTPCKTIAVVGRRLTLANSSRHPAVHISILLWIRQEMSSLQSGAANIGKT